MSYEIVYERRFVKVKIGAEDCIIPLVLSGSNNCYEPGVGKRDRRERSWCNLQTKNAEFDKRYGIPVIIEEDSDEHVEAMVGGDEDTQFFKNGSNWVDGKGFRRYWNNGVKDALTIEEINERRLYDTYVKVYYSGGPDGTYYNASCKDSESLANALIEAGNRKLEYGEGKVYIGFDQEGILTKNKLKLEYRPEAKKAKKWTKEQGHAYVLYDGTSYIKKLTARHIYLCYDAANAKQFKDQKTAEKWLEELYTKKTFNKFDMVRFKAVEYKPEEKK